MARSRRHSNAFSLFAFQDIITSVTAIMILIVLILTLEVVMRSRTMAVAEDHQAVAQDLKAAVARLEQQVEAARKNVAEAQRVADAVIGVDATELSRSVAEERKRDRTAAAALRAAEARATEAEVERREVDSLEAGAIVAHREQSRLEAEAKRLSGLLGEVEEEGRKLAAGQAALAGNDPAVVLAALEFNRSEGPKRPVVVDVTGAGVAVAAGIGETPRPLGWGFVGPPATLRAWLRGRDAAAESVLIVVRPSGVGRYDAVRKVVIAAGLDVGTELVGEATRILSAPTGSP